MTGEETTLGTSMPNQDQPGGPVDITSQEPAIGTMKFPIGPHCQWQATLPLTPTEALIATFQQRAYIGRVALDRILAEKPESRQWRFSVLRDEIMRLTGLHDSAASLAVFARRKEFKEI